MGHKKDYWEKIRSFIVPKLAIIIGYINHLLGRDYYVTADSDSEEYVGYVEMYEEEFEKVLHYIGFERNPISSYKHLKSDGNIEEGSFRIINGDKQIHCTIYTESDRVLIYAHKEYRWDTDPIKHYRGVELEKEKGARIMKKMLENQGVKLKQ